MTPNELNLWACRQDNIHAKQIGDVLLVPGCHVVPTRPAPNYYHEIVLALAFVTKRYKHFKITRQNHAWRVTIYDSHDRRVSQQDGGNLALVLMLAAYAAAEGTAVCT